MVKEKKYYMARHLGDNLFYSHAHNSDVTLRYKQATTMYVQVTYAQAIL